jgi:hypothetical protein
MARMERALRAVVAPFGIRTTFIADDPRLLAAAVAACPDSPSQMHEPGNAIEIRLETASIPSSNLSCPIEVEGSRIGVAGSDFDGRADAESKSGLCQVSSRLILDPGALADELLDPILLFLLARSGRTPIHAAGIMIDDRAVLLTAPSGSGKSSLAHAAMRRGLAVLSDDTVYIQLEPQFRVWGLPRPVHLLPKDAPPGEHPCRVRAGRTKAVVRLPPDKVHDVAGRAIVIILERGDRPALAAVSAEEAQAELARLEPGFDLLPEQSALAAQRLTREGAFKLTLASDPADAIDLLLHQLPRLG